VNWSPFCSQYLAGRFGTAYLQQRRKEKTGRTRATEKPEGVLLFSFAVFAALREYIPAVFRTAHTKARNYEDFEEKPEISYPTIRYLAPLLFTVSCWSLWNSIFTTKTQRKDRENVSRTE
jgi:hypothetical protein